MITALYAGSFDPITQGHIDIATRASQIFEKVYLGIFATPDRRLTFSIEEREEMARIAVSHLKNVEVKSYTCITVDFARQLGAKVLIRGLRMVGDFEWEFEMAMMNKMLAPDLELVCFMASQQYQFLSATLIKEVAGLGGDINGLVPEHVSEALRKKGVNKG